MQVAINYLKQGATNPLTQGKWYLPEGKQRSI